MTRIVQLNDQDPLEIGAADVEDGAVYICRCGLSAKWPYCDTSHANARREEDGKLYAHHREESGGELHTQVIADDLADADPRPDDA